MPRAPKHCGKPGCTNRVAGATYCPTHAPVAWAGPHQRGGSTRASRAARSAVLARDRTCACPGCDFCETGCKFTATQDDHIVPRSQGGSDDLSNRRGLCGPCHQVKTLAEARAARG